MADFESRLGVLEKSCGVGEFFGSSGEGQGDALTANGCDQDPACHSLIQRQPVEEETKNGPFSLVEDSTRTGLTEPQSIPSGPFP
jgi:hypothetical protein